MNFNFNLPGRLRLVYLACFLMFTTACGQKGDLYLPVAQTLVAHQISVR